MNEGIQRVLERAREAAGTKDVWISGGRNAVLQYLNAGLVDALEIALAPIFMGDGVRLFDGIDPRKVELEIATTIASPSVTHLRYRVKKRGAQ